MAKFRPIYQNIWNDPDFQEYTPEQKLIFVYLFSNPSTTDSGIYPITPRTIANDTGYPLETIVKLLSNGCLKNVEYDTECKIIYIRKARRHYPSGGRPDLVAKGIVNDFEKTNKTHLWSLFIEDYPEYKEVILSVGKPLSKGSTREGK
jgi:hypothetical protein